MILCAEIDLSFYVLFSDPGKYLERRSTGSQAKLIDIASIAYNGKEIEVSSPHIIFSILARLIYWYIVC